MHSLSSVLIREHLVHPFNESGEKNFVDLAHQKINIIAKTVFNGLGFATLSLALGAQVGIAFGLGLLGYVVVHFYMRTAYLKHCQKQTIDSFFDACKCGNHSKVKALLAEGFLHIKGEQGREAITRAVDNQQWNIVLDLVEHEADHRTIVNGKELIDLAIQARQLKLTILLLQKGVEELGAYRTPRLLSVISQFSERESAEILESCPALNPNPDCEHGLDPLSAACGRGFSTVVEKLVEKGALVQREKVSEGNTLIESAPLCLAAHFKEADIVRLLINFGASPKSIFFQGNTALHYACLKGHLEVVRELLKAGASLKTKNDRGLTPLSMVGVSYDEGLIATESSPYGMLPFEWILSVLKDSEIQLEIRREAFESEISIDSLNRLENDAIPLFYACLIEDAHVIKYLKSKVASEAIQSIKTSTLPAKYKIYL